MSLQRLDINEFQWTYKCLLFKRRNPFIHQTYSMGSHLHTMPINQCELTQIDKYDKSLSFRREWMISNWFLYHAIMIQYQSCLRANYLTLYSPLYLSHSHEIVNKMWNILPTHWNITKENTARFNANFFLISCYMRTETGLLDRPACQWASINNIDIITFWL